MSTGDSFSEQYRNLDPKFRRQADNDGAVYVPNTAPKVPVDYVLVSDQPSLEWAGSPQVAERKIRDGFCNFLYSFENFIVHYAAKKYLCKGGREYYITDVSKGAMWVKEAKRDGKQRRERWWPLLKCELELVGPEAKILPVGQEVGAFLKRKGVENLEPPLLHWSGNAAWCRPKYIRENELEDEFKAFAPKVNLEDIELVAEEVTDEAETPSWVLGEALDRLSRGVGLTESRKKLLFVYKHQMTG